MIFEYVGWLLVMSGCLNLGRVNKDTPTKEYWISTLGALLTTFLGFCLIFKW